jgi:hypothetical protein
VENKKEDSPKPYEEALQQGMEKLGARDGAEASRCAGCTMEGDAILVPFFQKIFVVRDGGRSVTDARTSRPVRAVEHILAVHYLATADGSPVDSTGTSFGEIPGGRFYEAVLRARSVVPLIRQFQNDGDAFERACVAAGGRRMPGSGFAMQFQAFPRVGVTCTYWPGEEEMPPGAGIVFDRSVPSYLPLEDVAVLGEYLAGQILKIAGTTHLTLYEYDEGSQESETPGS